jgi:hypothetical protein
MDLKGMKYFGVSVVVRLILGANIERQTKCRTSWSQATRQQGDKADELGGAPVISRLLKTRVT